MYSLAITTYNRATWTIESFAQVLDDPRILEVVIMDDASTDGSFHELHKTFRLHDKVILVQQIRNRGMSWNKFSAVSRCTNSWVILFDSDNIIDKAYLDAIPEKLDSKTIYCPSFARPQFDYTAFSGFRFNKDNIKDRIEEPFFEQLLNTSNYLVPRDKYCRVYQEDSSVKGSDTVYFAHLWLKAGNWFEVIPGMEYFHRVGAHSGWLKDAAYNIERGIQTLKEIKAL